MNSIRPSLKTTVAFALAALIGALCGVLIGPMVTIYYDSGFLLGLKGFVGAIVGGLSLYPLAAAGALLVVALGKLLAARALAARPVAAPVDLLEESEESRA